MKGEVGPHVGRERGQGPGESEVQQMWTAVEIDAATFPSMAAWFERVISRPSLQTLIEQDQGFLARLAG